MTREELEKAAGKRLDDMQYAAVMADGNTVVSAGAGSGKTTVLSIRFLRLVAERRAHCDEILTLTFTRKAALEMNERIKRLVSGSPLVDDSERSRLLDATISTLDAFVSRIVRLDCMRYGLVSSFTLEDDAIARRRRLMRLADSFFSKAANRRETAALAALYSPSDVVDRFFSVIDSCVTLVDDCSPARAAALLHESLDPMLLDAKEKLCEALGHLTDAKSEKNRAAAELSLSRLEELAPVSDVCILDKRAATADDKAWIDTARPLAGKYDVLVKALEEGVESPLQNAVYKFSLLLNAEKRRTAAIGFADAMALAIDILKTNAGVRKHFKESFKYIMIDEFQDNNSQQRDLLYLLSERLDLSCEGRVPTIDELEDSKLFFVGDEKQSIYLFRGADVSVFRNLQKEIGRQPGGHLELSINYRSTRYLIDHFNRVFSRVFASSDRDFEAQYTQTEAWNQDDTSTSVTLMCADRRVLAEECGELELDEAEAEAVASLVERMLNSDDYLVDGRRPDAGDIAILFARSTHQTAFELALKRHGVDYQVTVSRSLMQQAVSGDFYSLLQLVVHPDDRLALAACLRGPFARLSDEAVLTLLNGGQLSDGEDSRRYAAFSSLLDRLSSMAFRSSTAQLLSYMYYEGGYWAFLASRSDYEGFEEHFEYLLSYARLYDERGLGLTAFTAFLRDNLGSRSKLDEVSFLREQRQGVQLMTVHACKGLEFPIVILASCGSRDSGGQSEYIFSWKGQVVATAAKDLNRILSEDAKARAGAEIRRLLYVAATRAERHLVISGLYQLNKDGKLSSANGQFFNSYLSAAGWSPDGSSLDPAVRLLPIRAPQGRPRSVRRDRLEALMKEASEYEFRTFTSRPATARPSDDDLSAADDEMLCALASDGLWTDSERAAAFGTAVHAYLEMTVSGLDAGQVFSAPLFSGPEGRLARKDLEELADNFLSSGFYKDISRFPMRTEYRFFSWDEAEQTVWEGVVDLLVDLGDVLLVVDYKSDRSRSREKHKRQVVTYLRAMEDIFHRKCVGTLFYLREKSPYVFWNSSGETVSGLPQQLSQAP